jgi:hypothetical protein
MAEVTKGPGRTTQEIFEECRKYSDAERRQICEEFLNDVETLCDRMKDLFNETPGVFMMHGVTVKIETTLFNEPAYQMILGNADFHKAVMQMEDKLRARKEQKNDERA